MLSGAPFVAATLLGLSGPQDGAVPAPPLAPAGSINDAMRGTPVAFVTHAEPAVLRYVTAIRDRFARGAAIVSEAEFEGADLTGRRLVVYATPEHPWVTAHAARLPFTFDGKVLRIEGREFTGARLRAIAALHNPADPARRAVLFWAARAEDIVNVNAVFHGPTEWVVADGDRVLAAGAFTGVPLAAAQWAEDLEYLTAKIAAVHPAARDGLPEAVAAAAAAARERLKAPCTRGEGALALAGVLLALRDAHSALALPGSGQGLALPFAWLAEGPVVDADAGDLRRGDSIVAIAGRAPGDLLRLAGAVVPAENEHWLRHRAPAVLADLGLLRLLGVDAAPPVRVRVRREGAELDVNVPVGASYPARRRAESWVRYAIEPEQSLGILTVDLCQVDATYRDTLAEFFQRVHEQKVARIAVDLRANGGGDSRVTDLFLGYLDVASYASFGGDVRWSADALAQRRASGTPRFEPARIVRRPNARTSDPPPFTGEVFVLTGPGTFSSGKWFAVVLRDNGLAKVVGEPTGGAPCSYGDALTFTLPHSGCSFTLSFKRWVRPRPGGEGDDATLLPDVLVPRTAQTVRDGVDPVLAWLREAK